jgi:putative endonuclease
MSEYEPAEPRRSLGQIGEEIAARHLMARGYRIIDRSFRTGWGELDIVAVGDRALVFVEVTCRQAARSGDEPRASMDASRQVRLRRMAGQWLAQGGPAQRPLECRFDAIGVTVDADGALLRLDHLEAAF